MRVLFDIVHPADVLFFLHPIKALQARGDDILILSRKKDVACRLLDEHGLPHKPVSTAGSGLTGLAMELANRDLAVFNAARHFKPNVMVGLGGVAISHAGAVLRRPSVSFYMADTAGLQTRLTWPFISHLYVPDAYSGPVPDGRTSRFAGVKEQSYFHPANFEADRDVAIAAGLDPTVPNFVVRTVAWRANHDVGKSGWSNDTLDQLCAKLADCGKVHITTERELPEHLGRFSYRGATNQIHHLMAFSDLYVGESATMAHEAAFLGTAAIYDGADHPGTTRELAAAGLVTALRQEGADTLLDAVDTALSQNADASVHRLDRYLANKPNLSTYVVDALDRHAA